MRVALIGRSELLFKTAETLVGAGHSIALIITSKEAPEYQFTAEDFEVLSKKLGSHFIKTPKIIEHVEEIHTLDPIDIGISVNYSGIIPQEVIDCFSLGILNAHGGDLPKYRGNACQAWAIINGEDRIGLCIHRMIGGELDNGDIVARDYFPLNLRTKIGAVWSWMENRIPCLFSEVLANLVTNSDFIVEKQSRDPKHALRCYPRCADDGQIRWHDQSALQVLRVINASSEPYSGAFCQFQGKRIVIWDAELVEDGEPFCAIPGQVTAITSDGCVEIACSEGKVRLICIEHDGVRGRPSPLVVISLRQRFT